MFGTLLAEASTAQRTFFVNNTSPAGGDGTFAHPYNTLVAAEAASSTGDVIFVLVGDGTSTGMDAGIVLKDNQKLIGSGLPLITNLSGNGVELADNNEVSGIHLDSTAGWSIHGSSITKATLTSNLITNPATLGGIGIFDGASRIEITNSTIQNGGASENGIQIETHGTTVATAIISDNIITNFSECIVVFAFDSSSINSTISFNDVSQSPFSAIDVDAFDLSNSTTLIKENSVHDNTGNGIIAFSGVATIITSSAILHSTIQNNIVTNSGLEGIAVATGNHGQQIAHVLGNKVVNSGGSAGIIVETSSTASLGDSICLRLKNNDSDTGFFLQNFTGDTFKLEPLAGNVGAVTTTGTITGVPAGNCA